MRRPATLALIFAAFSVSGCVSTLVDVATAPVKVVSKGVDLATTSQSEADEKRGREIRRREERLAKLEREYENSWMNARKEIAEPAARRAIPTPRCSRFCRLFPSNLTKINPAVSPRGAACH